MPPIRPETPADHTAVREVVARAFVRQAEVPDLVEAIRASEHYLPDLALVAVLDGAVAGFVMGSHATLVDGDVRRQIVTLSPLAVAPERQRQGIGSALVDALAAAAERRGEPLLVLEGNPAYYGRLGFEHSVRHGIHLDLPPWAAPEAAQVRLLPAYDPAIRGHVDYPPAFDLVTEH